MGVSVHLAREQRRNSSGACSALLWVRRDLALSHSNFHLHSPSFRERVGAHCVITKPEPFPFLLIEVRGSNANKDSQTDETILDNIKNRLEWMSNQSGAASESLGEAVNVVTQGQQEMARRPSLAWNDAIHTIPGLRQQVDLSSLSTICIANLGSPSVADCFQAANAFQNPGSEVNLNPQDGPRIEGAGKSPSPNYKKPICGITRTGSGKCADSSSKAPAQTLSASKMSGLWLGISSRRL